jgi:hypothetical protein
MLFGMKEKGKRERVQEEHHQYDDNPVHKRRVAQR